MDILPPYFYSGTDGMATEGGEKMWMLCHFSRVFLYRPAAGNALMDAAGGVEEVYRMGSAEIDRMAGAEGLGGRLFDRAEQQVSAAEAEWCLRHKVSIIERLSPDYPELLRECADAPAVLYYRGVSPLGELLGECGGKVLGVVGTRLATLYGVEMCGEIISCIADQGYNPLIVSGLARGIDIAAHRAAMECGLRTLAVLPCGIDTVYPAAHRQDAVRMVGNGGILTEFPRGITPKPLNLLKRNRIIAGMCQAVLVCESRTAGGSMSTVRCANSYGRDVFAVPGRVTDVNSSGCNYLIYKNMAAICMSAQIIPEELGWSKFSPQDGSGSPEAYNREKLLLTLSSVRYTGTDGLVERSGLTLAEVLLALAELEADGRIRQNDRGEYALC